MGQAQIIVGRNALIGLGCYGPLSDINTPIRRFAYELVQPTQRLLHVCTYNELSDAIKLNS